MGETARHEAAPDAARAKDRAPGDGGATVAEASPHARSARLLALQRTVGNRVVARLVRANVQRVPITETTGETLFNREQGGQATARRYPINGSYDLTRQEDTGATVKVKVRFMSQSRNTVPPVPPATTPALGDMIDSPTEIPTGDPRREWAINTLSRAVDVWNGRLTFVGEEAPEGEAAGAPVPKRLGVTFQGEPVWTAAEAANATVIVHPPTSIGGSLGHPIDAGNFYQRRDETVYPANEQLIYAHEYGHLIGIPDEYSQSNRQMHLLLHQASPRGANDAMAALDRATVERMVLAAMARPLYSQLSASMPAVVARFRAARTAMSNRMTSALRTGIRDERVTTALRTRLEQLSADQLHRSVPRIAAFQTTTNFSARTRAVESVGAELAGPALTTRIRDAYWTALRAPHDQSVAVAGLGDVMINPATGVYGFAQGTNPAAAAGSGLAATNVAGAGSGPGATLPPVAPPSSLVGQLRALPATWSAAGSALEAAVTPEAVASRMAGLLNAANLAGAMAAVLPLVGASRTTQTGALYRQALRIVTNLSTEAARSIVGEFLNAQVNPVLTASVASLQTTVHTEVERLMNTPAGALASAAAPDPNLAAVVADMKSRLDAAKAATASSGSRDPIGASETTPNQDVTYSYQGLMGRNRTDAVRADQFAPMVLQFNNHFKKPRERDFTAETR